MSLQKIYNQLIISFALILMSASLSSAQIVSSTANKSASSQQVLTVPIVNVPLKNRSLEAQQESDPHNNLKTVNPVNPEDSQSEVTHLRRGIAIVASVVLGVVIHGIGQYILGDTKTANRLMIIEGISFGSAVAAAVVLALTGASKTLVGPAAIWAVTSLGVFGISAVAGLYSVAMPQTWYFLY